jgi:hypothetical protein
LGLLRAIGAVDSRYSTGRRALAVDVSERWLPAQSGVAAGAVPSTAEAGRELESAGLAGGSAGLAR